MVLGELPVPRRPTNLDYHRRARAYCVSVGVVWTLFLSSVISYIFFPLSGRRSDIDEILSERAIKPKTTNRLPSIYSILPFICRPITITSILAFMYISLNGTNRH